jgi:hypothetical protein
MVGIIAQLIGRSYQVRGSPANPGPRVHLRSCGWGCPAIETACEITACSVGCRKAEGRSTSKKTAPDCEAAAMQSWESRRGSCEGRRPPEHVKTVVGCFAGFGWLVVELCGPHLLRVVDLIRPKDIEGGRLVDPAAIPAVLLRLVRMNSWKAKAKAGDFISCTTK